MALNTDFNVNPYYDDYDEDKKFLRLMFKPGFAVQARELTQLQTILQKQVERFGNHVFKNGSVVQGGQTFIQDTTFLKLDTSYSGVAVNTQAFAAQTIVDNLQNPTKRAEVILSIDANAGTGDPKTLMVNQLYGEPFASGDTIITYDQSNLNSASYANIAASGTGTGQVFSIDSGIYYFDGFFIASDKQSIATSKYSSNTANALIGFDVTESLVSYTSDTSLLDPAQDASNYQAPGSDRFKINLVLSTRSLDSTDTESFIELARVENGILVRDYSYAIYSVLEDTLARRTYDESGNYTVKAFDLSLQNNAANSAKMDIILSPGKAYVYGYEYETIAPTRITIDKPRTTESVNNKRVSADYGYYVYTNNHFGTTPINSLDSVDIHCVPVALINTASTSTIANTKIGTARIKSLSFDSASDTTDGLTYEYQTFLFDVNVGSITGGVKSATSDTIVIGNTAIGQYYSTQNTAYVGAKLRITSGPGSSDAPKIITNFDGVSQTLTLETPYITTPTNTSTFSIDFEFNDAECFAEYSTTTRTFSANIDERSKDSATTYDDVIISDTSFEPLIFTLGEDFVASNTISDFSYSYKRLYSSVSFSSNVSTTLTVGAGESLVSALSSSSILQNYQLVVVTQGTSPYPVGTIIPVNKITNINTTTRRITVADGNNMVADIIATIDYTLASGSPAKVKTLVTSNTTIQTTGGETVNSGRAIVYASQGQTEISANSVVKIPRVSQSLYVSDVTELIQVLDYAGGNVGDVSFADVTDSYTLDVGQRDSFYDHASIKLKPGYRPPTGPLLVRYNLYTSSGAGFFIADSYPDYNNIPTYVSPTSGQTYSLRDVLDFRPVRRNATNALDAATITTAFDVDSGVTGPKIPENGSDIVLDYQYYLPRTDRIAVNKNRTFEVVQGEPSLSAVAPKEKNDSMTLYTIDSPAYVINTSSIVVNYVNNRRYTMRDIGSIERRVENLEYYTSLSLLEQDAVNKQDLTILDSTNLPRFKNGIVVDSFKGHSVADVSNFDYLASIDPTNQELRPSFNISSQGFTFDSANSTSFIKTGPFVTVSSSNTTFINQPLASKTMNINPFNIVNYIGKITLNPPSDTWVDVNRKPDVLVNIGGDKDAWDLILAQPKPLNNAGIQIVKSGSGYNSLYPPPVTITGGGGVGATARAVVIGGKVVDVQIINPGIAYTSSPTIRLQDPYYGTGAQVAYDANLFKGPFSYEWGSWQNTWTGTDTYQNTYWSRNLLLRDTVQVTAQAQTRSGIFNQVVAGTITKSIGDRVIDASVIPYMREKSVLFVAKDFKPDVILYPFFDNDSIEKYCARANRFILSTNKTTFNVTISDAETVNVRNSDTNTSNGTAITVATSNDSIFVVNINPLTTWNIANLSVVGTKTGTVATAIGYEHYSGRANNATANTIQFSIDAFGATNENLYGVAGNSSIISIATGTGAGQQATIESYNVSTRTATITGTWTTIPDTSSIYSVGRLTTTRAGVTAGVFSIPAGTFRTGEKSFRLVDTNTGDVTSSSTNGDASFFSQGLLNTVETTLVSTVQPVIQRTSVTDNQVTSSSRVTETVLLGWYDPLAQSFLVSPQNFKQGIFVEKMRFCFRSKDATAPVTLQVRPTVNGYPSATTIYPYSSVTLTPDQVNITDSPDLDDPTKYTDFVFETPIYLEPTEHSFVLVSNSRGYEAYVAEIGELDLVSGKQISEQPYTGSLFSSQNGSTWTADQNLDMTFRIYRKVFSTTPAVAQFQVNTPIANVKYDLVHLITSEVQLPNTSVQYSVVTEREIGGFVAEKPVNKLTDYTMDDGEGRRLLNVETGNNSFLLKATMTTNNPDISPFLDTTRFSGIFVDNDINNLPLLNSGFVIANSGSGYANSADLTVTISGGGGSGAVAYANVVSNTIDAIYLTEGGSGYTTSPTITITPGSGGGDDAVITYNGEDKKSGGNSRVRYMTRKVTLADGFESGDLRVYLTGYKPAGSNILVYYKLLSTSDAEIFDDKEYQLMTEIGNPNFISNFKLDFRELTFAPGFNGASNNSITYESGTTAYNTFKTFAIKLVLSAEDTTDVPKIRDLRVIALPRG